MRDDTSVDQMKRINIEMNNRREYEWGHLHKSKSNEEQRFSNIEEKKKQSNTKRRSKKFHWNLHQIIFKERSKTPMKRWITMYFHWMSAEKIKEIDRSFFQKFSFVFISKLKEKKGEKRENSIELEKRMKREEMNTCSCLMCGETPTTKSK